MEPGFGAGMGFGHTLRVPRPGRAFVPLAALALVPLAAWAGGLVRWTTALVVAAACVLLGVVRGWRALRDRQHLRRLADDLIRNGAKVHSESALLTWRSAELTSDRNRKILASSIRKIVRELEGRALPSAVPLNRFGARPHIVLIRRLAERLEDLDRDASPRGVLLVEDLLTDGNRSPLYVKQSSGELRPALERCLAALELQDEPRQADLSRRVNGSHKPSSEDRRVLSALVAGRR
jgi:hypothetical protein